MVKYGFYYLRVAYAESESGRKVQSEENKGRSEMR